MPSAQQPYVLSPEEALEEAAWLVRNQELWVHDIRADTGESGLACIVAVTRASDEVAAITKVYTNPVWRSRGCAERLVREVCRR